MELFESEARVTASAKSLGIDKLGDDRSALVGDNPLDERLHDADA